MLLDVVLSDHALVDVAYECEPIAFRHIVAGKPMNVKITRARRH
ncbi:hypothetical protein [Bradyrhizobium lablabi]|nr:hypothetical protein [Bradyrhizobium lablabi]